MLKVFEKAFYVLLTIMTIIVVIPGFVTVIGFGYAAVSFWVFGVDHSAVVVDVVNYVWRLYGLIN